MDSAPRLSVEDGQVFRSAEDATALIAVVSGVVGTADTLVVSSLSNVAAGTVHGTRCRLADQLSTSVAVEVVDHELGVVCSGADVVTQADTPKHFTVLGQCVAVNEDGGGEPVTGVVGGIRRFPLQKQLVLTVAVGVAHGTVVGGINIRSAARHSAFWALHGDTAIKVSPGYHRAGGFCRTTMHGHLITVLRRTVSIHVISRFQSLGYHRSVAQQVEGCLLGFRTQQAPTDEHTLLCCGQGYDPSVQLLHLRQKSVVRLCHHGQGARHECQAD